jgi:hypothetical protein
MEFLEVRVQRPLDFRLQAVDQGILALDDLTAGEAGEVHVGGPARRLEMPVRLSQPMLLDESFFFNKARVR